MARAIATSSGQTSGGGCQIEAGTNWGPCEQQGRSGAHARSALPRSRRILSAMRRPSLPAETAHAAACLSGGGQMGAAMRSIDWSKTPIGYACTITAATLAQHPKDVPFVLVYLFDRDRPHARLARSEGIETRL